eukprot:361393-Chlamydomonas_euryale.AAC.1
MFSAPLKCLVGNDPPNFGIPIFRRSTVVLGMSAFVLARHILFVVAFDRISGLARHDSGFGELLCTPQPRVYMEVSGTRRCLLGLVSSMVEEKLPVST